MNYDRQASNSLAKYYLFREPTKLSSPPPNSELAAYEYRGWLIARSNHDYILWSIKTLDGGLPPVALRSDFTTKDKAQKFVDDYLDLEFAKQMEAEATTLQK